MKIESVSPGAAKGDYFVNIVQNVQVLMGVSVTLAAGLYFVQ